MLGGLIQMIIETWKQIENSKYEVSNLGVIRNSLTGRILKTFIVDKGNDYKVEKIKLPINGSRKTYSVHRLVAIAFIDNVKNKSDVDHKDRNPLNNKYTNLRWCTRKENLENRVFKKVLTKSLIRRILKLSKEGFNYNEI